MLGNGQFEETATDDTASVEVAPSPTGHQRNPSVALGPDGSLHIAWSDTRSGLEQIMVAHAIDGGWSEATPVLAGDRQLNPSLAIDDAGTVLLAWQELHGDQEQVRLHDGTWLEETGHEQWQPVVSFAHGVPVIAWTDFRDGQTPFIRVKCGAETSQRVDMSTAAQSQPALLDDQLAWLDYRDRSWHVRRSTACSTTDSVQVSAASDHEVLAADPRFFRDASGAPALTWDEIRDRRGRRRVQGTEATDEQRVRPANATVFQGEKRIATNEQTLITGAVWQPIVIGRWLVFTDGRSGWRRIRVLAL